MDESKKYEFNRIGALGQERTAIQTKFFTKWINTRLGDSDMKVVNLFVDLRDGRILTKLLEVLSGKKLGKLSKGNMRIHHIENVYKCIDFLKFNKCIRLENIDSEDIVNGNKKIILGLIWTIILTFQINDIEIQINKNSSEKSYSKPALLLWCQRLTQVYPSVNVHDFTQSWRSGIALNALIHAHRPDLIDFNSLNTMNNNQCLNNAFDVAESHLGIPKLLDAEDVDTENPDEKSLLVYISSYYHTFVKIETQINFQPNNQIIQLNNLTIESNNFSVDKIEQVPKCFTKNFTILNELGTGGFGTVFRAEDNSNKRLYAVKKVLFSENTELDRIMREVNHLSKCSGDYVVNYFDSWIEDNKCLYIQMELCLDNLKTIIQQKPKCFQRKNSEVMDCMEYFISGHLFKELVECVQYLHESKPPIIHRDLKPHNILIAVNRKNGRFLKICDFGLATEHELSLMSHTRDLGTIRYMAPEVYQGIDHKSVYSTKADIYSIGVIGQELFDFDIFSSQDEKTNVEILRQKWLDLVELMTKIMNPRYNMRPDCNQILELFRDQCLIDFMEIKSCDNYNKYINLMKDFSKNLFYEYFKEKLKS